MVRPEEGTLLFQHYLHITNNNKKTLLNFRNSFLPFLIEKKTNYKKPLRNSHPTPHSLKKNLISLQIFQSVKDSSSKLKIPSYKKKTKKKHHGSFLLSLATY